MDAHASEARLLGNGEIHKKFNKDDHYIVPTSNCPPPSFCVAVDCHEGYMLISRLGDETYVKLV